MSAQRLVMDNFSRDRLRPVVLDAREYANGLALFRERTNLMENMLGWFNHFVNQSIPANTKSLSVFSVGCGNGEFDLSAIDILTSRVDSLVYDGIEPNAVMRAQLVNEFSTRGLTNVSLNIRPGRFEEFSTVNSYDLVHLTNCINFMPDRLLAIGKALSMLRENGQLVIMLFTRTGFQDLRLTFSQRVRSYKSNVCVPQEIESALLSLDVDYDYQHLPGSADVTECFQWGSEKGVQMLNFILGCDTTKLDCELKISVLEKLKAMCTQRGGRTYMPHSIGVFTVKK